MESYSYTQWFIVHNELVKGIVLLLMKNVSNQLILNVKKFNLQYGGSVAKTFNKSHDGFLIMDKTDVYNLGASLKDLGKKCLAFSKLEISSVGGLQ